ncbi:hypothetical protein [Rhodococcus sp. 11-3]|uniref:hypothetical protein n=1 Tax=Rhodococcus sp. 11-3 TaxID=2854796 RepID=UPI00203E1B22|nr:hypothetical protein [Rhodococcus sp. 11-3]USC16974.1 hypothetical protein KZJ41_08965 [Rhodococcus sp. 11-3]
MTDYVLTHHATRRAVEMNLSPEEIRAAIESPTKVWVSPTYGSQMRRNGRITAACVPADEDPNRLVVQTIVWATKDGWRRYYESGHMPPDRRYRDDINIPN